MQGHGLVLTVQNLIAGHVQAADGDTVDREAFRGRQRARPFAPKGIPAEAIFAVLRDPGLLTNNLDYWTNEKESPYTEVKRFDWFRGYHVGGRSLMWGRQSYRWSDIYFEDNLKDGIAIDWPIRYKDLAPWYDHVEKFIGVNGSMEGLEQLPDGHFLPAMQMNCVEKDVSDRIKKHYNNMRHMIIGRSANLTAAIPGRTKCQFRNRCWEGCP